MASYNLLLILQQATIRTLVISLKEMFSTAMRSLYCVMSFAAWACKSALKAIIIIHNKWPPAYNDAYVPHISSSVTK